MDDRKLVEYRADVLITLKEKHALYEKYMVDAKHATIAFMYATKAKAFREAISLVEEL